MPPIKTNRSFFKKNFFHSTIIQRNKLDSNIFCSPSYKFFSKGILEFIRLQPNNVFNVPSSLALAYYTKLRVGLSSLREHKVRHNFRDSLNSICYCGNAIELTKHYFLHYSTNFNKDRQHLLQNFRIANPNILSINEDLLTHLLLYGNNILTDNTNTFSLNSVIESITSTKRFNNLLIL